VWAEAAALISPSGGAGNVFGTSVSVSAAVAVVGEPGSETGRAYVFEPAGGTWVDTAVVLAEDGRLGDQFGMAVSLDAEDLVAGAPGADGEAAGEGAAYVFAVFPDASEYENLGQCITTLKDAICVDLTGQDRADCNHAVQDFCRRRFGK
jgi:hypothetical protein